MHGYVERSITVPIQMFEYYLNLHEYVDWSISVPIQTFESYLNLRTAKTPFGPAGFWKLSVGTVCMLAFGYAGETETINTGTGLILRAVKALIGPAGFWKLSVGTVCMLAFGYAGEIEAINPGIGFTLSMCGWDFILFEIFAGESAMASGAQNVSAAIQQSLHACRRIRWRVRGNKSMDGFAPSWCGWAVSQREACTFQ